MVFGVVGIGRRRNERVSDTGAGVCFFHVIGDSIW